MFVFLFVQCDNVRVPILSKHVLERGERVSMQRCFLLFDEWRQVRVVGSLSLSLSPFLYLVNSSFHL